jgi:hypothetical protein
LQLALGQKAGFRFDTNNAVATALIEGGHAEVIRDKPLTPFSVSLFSVRRRHHA